MVDNKVTNCFFRQSYDVDIELNIPGTNTKSTNSLDLKNPFFRYTGQTVSIGNSGNSTVSPTDAYWNSMATGQQITGTQKQWLPPCRILNKSHRYTF